MRIFLIFTFFFLSSIVRTQTLTSIYFKVNKADLDEISKMKLDSLSQLKSNLTFRIFGNCDVSGDLDFNKKLSESRAEAVTEYLQTRISSNINIGNSVGLGITKQINDNSTASLREKNRRADIFIEKQFEKGEKINRKEFPSFLAAKVSLMKVKDTFSLPDVNFIGGRHVWLPQGYVQVAELSKKLKDNPTLMVELQGHICCEYQDFDGEDLDLGTFNLSWTRANAIKEFLLKQGIEESRIKIVGLGHLNPVVYPENTEEDRTRNRRVEIMLLKK